MPLVYWDRESEIKFSSYEILTHLTWVFTRIQYACLFSGTPWPCTLWIEHLKRNLEVLPTSLYNKMTGGRKQLSILNLGILSKAKETHQISVLLWNKWVKVLKCTEDQNTKLYLKYTLQAASLSILHFLFGKPSLAASNKRVRPWCDVSTTYQPWPHWMKLRFRPLVYEKNQILSFMGF